MMASWIPAASTREYSGQSVVSIDYQPNRRYWYKDHYMRIFARPSSFAALLALLSILLTAGCTKKEEPKQEYVMGERALIGPLTYRVLDSGWLSQLGEVFKIRFPEQRFLILTVSITNGGGKELSVPLLSLVTENGQIHREVDNGEGVVNWLGLLRSIDPAQTLEGRIVFDVPLTSYRLRITDGGDAEDEKEAFIAIPLRMDVDTQIKAPTAQPTEQPAK